MKFDQHIEGQAFTPSPNSLLCTRVRSPGSSDNGGGCSLVFVDGGSSSSDSPDDEAERLRQRARDLREEIRKMESELPDDRRRIREESTPPTTSTATSTLARNQTPLSGARVLVAGANGRLGSMVCRYLLREVPEIKEVIAMVHVVSENSSTARGYGRLSYEIGAEDGIGTIGPAWSSADERTQSFEFDAERMTDYNLQKIRVVECELLDPLHCKSIMEDSQADVVVWCATDYNGNRPRAISSLNVAFLFRALADPDKGRVEVEGLQNMLGAIKTIRQENIQRRRLGGLSTGVDGDIDVADDENSKNKPVDILLVSMAPNALKDFETPFGTLYDVKRQGEDMIPNEFPSLSYTILQMGEFDDNFVEEGLELRFEEQHDMDSSSTTATASTTTTEKIVRRRINRRDAARAIAVALNKPDFKRSKVQVWTNEVGSGRMQ